MIKRDLFLIISFHAIFIIVPSNLFDVFSLTSINEWNMNGNDLKVVRLMVKGNCYLCEDNHHIK